MINFLNVDLSGSLNCKKVSPVKENNELTPYRTESGLGLLNPEIYLASGSTVEIASIPFIFPNWTEETYDTLCCEGQILKVPPAKYKTYHILGYCDHGYFQESLFFHKADKTKTEAELFLHRNWRGARGFKLERENINCSFALLTKSLGVCPLGIYRYSAEIPRSGEIIDAIELPFNPNMNILSISLGY